MMDKFRKEGIIQIDEVNIHSKCHGNIYEKGQHMSNMNAKCSIIMPVRNGAQYLRESISSVLSQSFSDWNLIIVNDASTDETNEVVSEFLDDNRIQYIPCSQCVGVSKARNIGLAEAAGRYLVFLDCDDYLLKDSIKNRVEGLKQYSSELGLFGSVVTKGRNIIKDNKFAGGVLTNRNFMGCIKNMQAGKVVGIEYVWDKIFDLQIIKEENICFNEKWDRYEDQVFVMDYLKCLDNRKNRILLSPTCVYEYHINMDSISNSFDMQFIEKTQMYFQYVKRNLEYYDMFKGENEEGYYHGYINKVIGQVIVQKNRGGIEGLEKQLSEDEDFLEGLRRYKIRNEHETTEILDILKEKFL